MHEIIFATVDKPKLLSQVGNLFHPRRPLFSDCLLAYPMSFIHLFAVDLFTC